MAGTFRSRLQNLVIHPACIALVIWAVMMLFMPPLFPKFTVKNIQNTYNHRKTFVLYSDLDSDRKSEKILVDYVDSLQTKVQILKGQSVLDQYDLVHGYMQYCPVYPGDCDGDGNKELYVFTLNRDSIFLNVIDPVITRKIWIHNRYIDSVKASPHSVDMPHIQPVGMLREQGKRTECFVFFINTGYSKYPRNVYLYDPYDDSLIRSPRSASGIAACLMADIDRDTESELVLHTLSPGNYKEEYPYSDKYSWLMVLDAGLRFRFPPVQFREHPSRLQVIPLDLGSHTRLVGLHDYFGTDRFKSALYMFDTEGNQLGIKYVTDLENVYNELLIRENNPDHTFYLFKNRNTDVVEMDSSFRVIRSIKMPPVESCYPVAHLDANLDNRKEYFFRGSGNGSLVIAQEDLRNAVTLHFGRNDLVQEISQVLLGSEKPLLFLQFRDHGMLVRFSTNPFHALKYPFYLALYLGVLLLVWFIARIQRHRLILQQETEKKMAALQLKAIKNQMDPHFTLNILNAIGSLYSSESNRDKADYIFSKYARLIRDTVVTSDQIIVPLSGELDFVSNYLELERFRRDYSFDFSIDVSDTVDIHQRVPRMLIYTFTENSVKYSIRKIAQGGMIRIRVLNMVRGCQVIIEDNGPGISPGRKEDSGTGKGLALLGELSGLFYKLERVRISYELVNITDAAGKVSGTRATVNIER